MQYAFILCLQNHTLTTCLQDVTFDENIIPLHGALQVFGAPSFFVIQDLSCLNLTLTDIINGGNVVTTDEADCLNDAYLHVENSNFVKLTEHEAEQVTIDCSSVYMLHKTQTKLLTVSNSSLHEIYRVHVASEMQFIKSHVRDLHSLILQAPANISYSDLRNVSVCHYLLSFRSLIILHFSETQ